MSDGQEVPFVDTLRGGELYSSLEVVKNTKGYNWTVKIAGLDVERAKEKLVETEKFLRDTYGANE